MNPITYNEAHAKLVAAYEALPLPSQKPKYWEAKEIDPIRGLIKAHYISQQANKCCYCKTSFQTNHGRAWDVEHIVARSTHPQFLFEPENLAIACIDCNVAKGESNVLVNRRIRRYPRRSDAFTIVHPHYDDYDKHVAILCDRIYIGRTKKGEETIISCRLTRYAYEHVGWDRGLAEEPQLMQAFDKYMTSPNPEDREVILMEIMLRGQVRLSRSLR